MISHRDSDLAATPTDNLNSSRVIASTVPY